MTYEPRQIDNATGGVRAHNCLIEFRGAGVAGFVALVVPVGVVPELPAVGVIRLVFYRVSAHRDRWGVARKRCASTILQNQECPPRLARHALSRGGTDECGG